MAKISYVYWTIRYVEVICDCGEHVKVVGKPDWTEEQSEYGEIDVNCRCPFCNSNIKLKCDLEDYSSALNF